MKGAVLPNGAPLAKAALPGATLAPEQLSTPAFRALLADFHARAATGAFDAAYELHTVVGALHIEVPPGAVASRPRLLLRRVRGLMHALLPACAQPDMPGAWLRVGAGTFGIVHRATHRASGDAVAVKILPMPACLRPPEAPGNAAPAASDEDSVSRGLRLDAEDVLKEVHVLCRLRAGGEPHPGVLRLREHYVSAADDTVRLVTDLLPGGPLLEALLSRGGSAYDEHDARTAFAPLLRALHHLHSRGVTHRDVKLDNVLLRVPGDLGSGVLIDYGMASTDFEGAAAGPGAGGGMRWLCGSSAYVAPEVADRRIPYTNACDIWSAGVVLHLLLTGLTPFPAGDDDDDALLLARAAAWTAKFDGPEWAPVSSPARELCASLLSVDPAVRPSASRALMHPWLVDEPPAGNAAPAPRVSGLHSTLLQLRLYAKQVGMPVVEFAKGAVLGTAGARCTNVYLIKSGTVEVLLPPPEGAAPGAQPHVVARRGPGELVGEMDLSSAGKLVAAPTMPRTDMAHLQSDGAAKGSKPEAADSWMAIMRAKRAASKWVGARRRTTLRAATDVRAVVVGSRDFQWVLQHDHAIAEEVERFVGGNATAGDKKQGAAA